MMNEIEGLLQRVTTGEVDQQSISQAANDHVSAMDQGQLAQHMQNAADSANNNGQSGVAQQIMGIVTRDESNPQALKQDAISLIQSNPQVLQHFAPEFAKGILGRI